MKAVILGSGKCARDIGAYLLTRGHAVTWLSHSAERLESLRAQTGRVVRRLAGKGPAPDASFHIYGSAVGPPAEILIEATVEGAGEKRNAFGAARALCAPSTLLWTNSSSILARDIAGDAINVHFFYPLELARLAEVIRFGPDGPHDRTVALLHDLDIKVIEQTEGNAFAVNRLLLPCQNELFRLLMRGQSASALDAASAAGIFPAGLLALMDGVGLDVIAAGARNYCGRMRPDERAEFAPLLDGLTALTSLGKAGSKNRNGLLCGDPLRWPASGAAIDERALTRRFAALFLNTCLRFIERGEILGPDCDLALDRALGSESSLLDAVRRLGRDAMVKDLRDGRDETGCRYFEPSTLIDPYCERPPAVVAAVMQSIANATLLPYEEALREETRIFLGAAQPTTEQRDAGASRGFVAVTGKRSEVRGQRSAGKSLIFRSLSQEFAQDSKKRTASSMDWCGARMRTSAGQPPELPGAMPRIRSITETVSIADTAARRAALCAEYFAGGEVPALRGLPDRTLAGWIAVKRAVVKVLGPDSSPSEIVVEPVGTGGVSVRIRGKEGPRVRVSVSHTRDIAYGIACVEDPA